MKKIILLLLVTFYASNLSAQWGKKIKGNGDYTTIERSIEDYDKVSVSGWFDVVLVSGTEGKLSLEGESNLLEYIKTEVKDGRLNIKPRKGVNLKPSSYNNGIVITVPVQEIDAVSLSGSGDIVGKTVLKTNNFKTSLSGSGDISLEVEAQEMEASMSGSGDINLDGTAENFTAKISGSGDIKAYGLEAENVSATVSGSADIEVTANTSIKARVTGSGDISYRGNPKKIDTKSSGSGDITEGE